MRKETDTMMKEDCDRVCECPQNKKSEVLTIKKRKTKENIGTNKEVQKKNMNNKGTHKTNPP